MMYFPSFFGSVRPFETVRERVENPLDLSVKQTVSRTEGSQHEDLQLLMERKLATVTNGIPSQPLTQQMPLLDNMFSYKPFGADSLSCQMRGTTGLLGQNMSGAFCTTTSSGHTINHLGLVPDVLHQNSIPLSMEGNSSLTSFAMNGVGLPYHHPLRLSNAVSAAAVMANQRAYYGHNTVLPPHMSGPFSASIPHISLYNDLMSDITRRPVEPEGSVFGTLSPLRTPPDPTNRFSDHLQRLRGHHMQQSKCSGPCCLPYKHTNANHCNNGCNCCDVGLAMPSNVPTLVLPSSHSTSNVSMSVPVSVPVSVPMSVSCNDLCNRDILVNNNQKHSLSDKSDKNSSNNKNENKNSLDENCVLIKSHSLKQKDFELKSQLSSELQSAKKVDTECEPILPNHDLWNPSHCNKQVVQPIDCHNNHLDKNGRNSNDSPKETFPLNSSVSNEKDTGFPQNGREVITLDDRLTQNTFKKVTHNLVQSYETQKIEFSDNQNQCTTDANRLSLKSESSHPSNVSSNSTTGALVSHISGQNPILIYDKDAEQNSLNVSKCGTEKRSDSPHRLVSDNNQSQSKPKQEFNENDFLFAENPNHEYSGRTQQTLPSAPESVSTKESYFKDITDHKSEPQVKGTTCSVSVKNVTKQLKDYKPVVKQTNNTSIDKSKRQTKTVEVQCDGPDWTPIVLPAQLKKKLQKVVRKKLFGKDCKKLTSLQMFSHKRDSKKRKKCKQKHIHRIESRSRSSSVSTLSSRSSSHERESEGIPNKSRKHSMLQCLINSEGYVADKIKKTGRTPNLIASDPSQLGREERALQRAIKHIEDLNKAYARDYCEKNNAEALEITQNNNPIDENKSNDSNGTDTIEESHTSKNLSETYDEIIESVVIESRLYNQCSEQTNNSSKKTKKLKDCEENDSKTITEKNERTQPLIKIKDKSKRKLRERLNELQDEDQQQIDQNIGFKTKKKKVEQNKKCDNKVIKMSESGAQTITNTTKQKKGMVTIRRRRFRSGLDMIRNGQRRKKARNNQTQGSNNKKDSNRSLTSKSEEIIQKTKSEPANGSVPTEMKRLMVNKALGETLLHRAARSNRLDVVNFCLHSSTCDVNARDNANYTPLHECSTRGNLQIARLLLQNGADVNASAAGGIRPIHDAIENNHIEVVRLLLSYGADPNISTYSGSTAIQLSRSKAMLKFLKGFLSDISNESQREAVLSWKFNGSSNILDTNQTGFDILDGLPSDEVEEESHDFLFEVSDSPMDPTYRLPNLCSKGSDHFMRLSDVLNRIGLKREEFVEKHLDIKMISVTRHELEAANVGQILIKSKALFTKSDGLTEDIVLLDDRLRDIMGIDILRLR